VYELVENDDSILKPPIVGMEYADAVVTRFLNGDISVYYDRKTDSLRWQEVEQGEASETVDASISTLKRDVELDPNSVRAHHDLGVALAKKGFLDQAIREFTKAIELNPNFEIAHTCLGVVYSEKGLVDKVIEEHKLAIELNPDCGDAHVNLGHAYLDKGLVDRAIKEYELALHLDPNLHYACDGLGSAYASKGLFEKAIIYFKRTVELEPYSPVARRNLGRAYNDKGLTDEAIKEFKIAVELDPDDATAHNDLGFTYSRKGLLDKAIEEYELATKLDPDNALYHASLGDRYYKKGLWDKAITEYKLSIELEPENAGFHNNLGAVYVEKGLSDQATREFERALELDPNLEFARKNLESIRDELPQSAPVLEDNSGLIRPDDHFRNRILYQRMILRCEEFLYWIDKYFSQAGFNYLFNSLDSESPKIKEIKILMAAIKADERFRNVFKEFAESMKKIGIMTELRVITDRELEKSIHDRWILSKNVNFNIPSPDIVKQGQWSEIKETISKLPFNEWWDSSKDIIHDWNTIRMFKEERAKS